MDHFFVLSRFVAGAIFLLDEIPMALITPAPHSVCVCVLIYVRVSKSEKKKDERDYVHYPVSVTRSSLARRPTAAYSSLLLHNGELRVAIAKIFSGENNPPKSISVLQSITFTLASRDQGSCAVSQVLGNYISLSLSV